MENTRLRHAIELQHSYIYIPSRQYNIKQNDLVYNKSVEVELRIKNGLIEPIEIIFAWNHSDNTDKP